VPSSFLKSFNKNLVPTLIPFICLPVNSQGFSQARKVEIKKGPSPAPLDFWLSGVHDLRTTTSIDSIGYPQESPQKSDSNESLEPGKTDVVNKAQHIIHKAMAWEKMLEDGKVESLSEIAARGPITGPVRLLLFPDRLEVISPGAPPNGVTEENMQRGGISVPRNYFLFQNLKNMNYVDMLGRGLEMIYKEIKTATGRDPKIEVKGEETRLILWRADFNVDQ
jgi:hypothetical protein